MEHIKDIIHDFTDFKEEVGRNEMMCNNIQKIISLWKEDSLFSLGLASEVPKLTHYGMV